MPNHGPVIKRIFCAGHAKKKARVTLRSPHASQTADPGERADSRPGTLNGRADGFIGPRREIQIVR